MLALACITIVSLTATSDCIVGTADGNKSVNNEAIVSLHWIMLRNTFVPDKHQLEKACGRADHLGKQHELFVEMLAFSICPPLGQVLQLQVLHRIIYATVGADEAVTLSLCWIQQVLLHLCNQPAVSTGPDKKASCFHA